jgi:hypothetical protein|nr:hypothetical protein [Kofleriaceae bacterium]
MMSKLFTVAMAAALATACQSSKDTKHEPSSGATGATGATGAATPDVTADSKHGLVEGEVAHAEHAEQALDSQREMRAERLESRLELLQIQEPVLRALSDVMPLTDTGRVDVDAKLDAFASKLDQAQLALDSVEAGTNNDFAAAEQTARTAFQAADTARAQAWKSIGAARVPATVGPSAGSAAGSATGSATTIPPST